MKYVALLSGGKDSCYNLLHCAKNGHELVAAASLRPASGQGRDYFSIAIFLEAEAEDEQKNLIRIFTRRGPLYRQVITGSAVAQGSEYGGRSAADAAGIQGDETEDLLQLLSAVKVHHPDIQAVSVGAILSNYQRVRVEHVCQRLGLTPLCYLWQRNQAELLAEMIDAGVEAILIKVAGIGLTTKHLGKTLADMQPVLTKLNQLYGSHICGEGGEYESLTLDCPLFKHRVTLTEVETVIHSDSDFATVAYLRIKGAALEPKSQNSVEIAIPPLLEDDFLSVKEAVSASQHPRAPDVTPIFPGLNLGVRVKDVDPWVTIANVQVADSWDTAAPIEDEVLECFRILQVNLNRTGLQLHHCVNVNIFLASIELFNRVNAVYKSFFGVSPPARACLAVDLSKPARVRFDCLALREQAGIERRALHVQGLSYWAPANIGPYSQAILAQQWLFVSGQIGLIPSSLTLPTPANLAMEVSLACQHVHRVVEAVKANSGLNWTAQPQLQLYWLTSENDMSHIRSGHRMLIKSEVPTLFLVVQALPKDALVEKQSLFHTGLVPHVEENEIFMENKEQRLIQGNTMFDGGEVHWQVSQISGSLAASGIICVRGNVDMLWDIIGSESYLEAFRRAQSIRLFYVATPPEAVLRGLKAPCTPVPCRSIATLEKDRWDYVLCALTT